MLDEETKALKGSPHRDQCKFIHKQLGNPYYCLDLDLVFIEKYPPGIAAFLDYKKPWEVLTFTEVIAYNDLREKAPVFICHTEDAATWQFVIYEFMGGDHLPHPPVSHLRSVATVTSQDAWRTWEQQVRAEYRARARTKKTMERVG